MSLSTRHRSGFSFFGTDGQSVQSDIQTIRQCIWTLRLSRNQQWVAALCDNRSENEVLVIEVGETLEVIRRFPLDAADHISLAISDTGEVLLSERANLYNREAARWERVFQLRQFGSDGVVVDLADNSERGVGELFHDGENWLVLKHDEGTIQPLCDSCAPLPVFGETADPWVTYQRSFAGIQTNRGLWIISAETRRTPGSTGSVEEPDVFDVQVCTQTLVGSVLQERDCNVLTKQILDAQ